ncbi:g7125 [Coccomyxa viridis]|uniref:G7125 protein n=1 Tax=Coccomyxa viridis TaxID=1274662 RepID=A0ABP1FX17_9CHLO
MRHAGRIPDLHLYVGKPGQGLKAREYHSQRKAIVNTVLETAMRAGAVMVTGPPQSGKTSLLQLLHEAAVRSELFSFTYYVNVAENNKSLEQGLVQHGTSWEELFAAGSAGGWLLNWRSCCNVTLDSDISLERLRLSKPEYHELLSNFRMLECPDALFGKEARKALYLNTAGQTRTVLKRLLKKECRAEGINQIEDRDVWTVARDLYYGGYFAQREVYGVDHIGFISPLHRKVCKQLDIKAQSAPAPSAGG